MFDPGKRWGETGKPDYAGLATFGGMPYTEEPDDLVEVDVAIVGAPMDELVSHRPGTRYGPRAIRSASAIGGAELETGIDAFEELQVVDYGDAPVRPADPAHSHAAIEATVSEVVAAGTIPIVLGGDHSIAEPDVRACAGRFGPMGLIQFDTHTDTGTEVFGAEFSHGTPMYRLVEDGHVDGSRYAQIGLRGDWPGPEEFEWQEKHGITAIFMHEIRDGGIKAAVDRAVEAVGDGPVFLSVDIDVLDPVYAPGTGTPEPGGMTSSDLLWACREVASRAEVVGVDLVEVIPTGIGAADITSHTAVRTIDHILIGIAQRRA